MVAQMKIHVSAEYVENASLTCVSFFCSRSWNVIKLPVVQLVLHLEHHGCKYSSIGFFLLLCWWESHRGQLFQKQMMSELQTNSCQYGSDLRRYWNRHQRCYFTVIPYHLYCPTLQLNRHRHQNSCVTPEPSASKIFVPTSDDTKDCVPQYADDDTASSGTGDMVNQNEALPVFRNIFDILKSPWEDL